MTQRQEPYVTRPGQTESSFTCPICAKGFKTLSAFYRHLKTAHQAGQGERTKFNNRKVELDGYVFGSGSEAQRYQELLLLQKAGEIEGLVVHPVFRFVVNRVKVGRYTADFKYQKREELPWWTVEDVKGGEATKTEAYGLRKRLMLACQGIKIQEV